MLQKVIYFQNNSLKSEKIISTYKIKKLRPTSETSSFHVHVLETMKIGLSYIPSVILL